MNHTIAALLPLLQYLAGPGAGVLAALLFAALRREFPVSTLPRALALCIWSRRGARLSALLLAGLLGLAASAALAWAQGQPITLVVDALAAALVSQIWHAAIDLSAELPAEESPV